jgi:hypothetical protein
MPQVRALPDQLKKHFALDIEANRFDRDRGEWNEGFPIDPLPPDIKTRYDAAWEELRHYLTLPDPK